MHQYPQHNISIPTFPSSHLILSSIKIFSSRHKLLSTSYLIGILVLLILGNGFHVSQSQYSQYNRIMNTIDLEREYHASQNMYRSQEAYLASKGWFTCDDLCQRNKRRVERDRRVLKEVREVGYAKMKRAKSVVGLFSDIGVGEVKDLFWNYFSQGLKFAKRQSMWDMMFLSIRSIGRDESFLEYALKIGFQIFINLSMGLVMCLGIFVFGLWSVVKSYSTSPFVSAIQYLLCVSAAFSLVATCWMIMTGVAVAGVMGVGKVMSQRGRLGYGNGGYYRMERQTPRPHYY